ncbi:MAG: MFS transporter [Methanomicrobiales archaeon HGW-Methanomicrobiales-4]|nr:MAG: MFS transporter [Methanomicrobiales archaeon HGW-Methanomicrobiales-4]
MDRSSFHFFIVFFGVFSLMALSNAIVPVLPNLNVPLDMQAFIFSLYFLGAMVSTLPGGIISDRIGQIPVIGVGLIITLVSGTLLLMGIDPVLVLISRFIEGIGAGLFVAAGLSWINNQGTQNRLSGIFMALLNLGLLAGMVFGGWIAGYTGTINGGILLFTGLTLFPFAAFLLQIFTFDRKNTVDHILSMERRQLPVLSELVREVTGMVVRQAPLWYSVIILLGITGFVQALYPDLSGLSPLNIGVALAIMNLATIIASLGATWIRVEPVLLIRISAILMGGLVLIFVQYPISIFLMGFAAGLIMISQINYLASAEEHQGMAMGLFSTSSYAGMTLLPAIGGYITGLTNIGIAAVIVAFLAIICAITIGRCKCRNFLIPFE